MEEFISIVIFKGFYKNVCKFNALYLNGIYFVGYHKLRVKMNIECHGKIKTIILLY